GAKLRALARNDLPEFQQRIGTTTIYVTHDQIVAMGMGHRIVVMYAGTLRQIGAPGEVYDDPADTFVATFLGSPPMNLVPRGDRLVGFRPENVLPADALAGAVDGHQTMALRVRRIVYFNDELLSTGSDTVL